MAKHKQVETAVLTMSDLHYGRKTSSYNPRVFGKRMDLVGQKLTRIKELLSGYEIDKLVIAILGDVNDGSDIYPTQTHEQAESNVEQQAEELSSIMSKWLLKQQSVWGEVEVECVPGNHGRCHDEETELLTINGWKKHSELSPGELVATYRVHGGILEWQPLQAVHRYDYDGIMYHIQDRENDAMVTPNHRMVVFGGANRVQPIMCEMWQLAERRPVGWRLPKIGINERSDYAGVTDDELRLVGWLITDGAYKHSVRGKTQVMLYQSKPEGIEKIKTLLDRLGYGYTQRVRVREGEYAINGVTLKTTRPAYEFYIRAAFVDRALALLPDKHQLPAWVYLLSTRQANVLLDSLLDGDGSRWKRNSRVLWGRATILGQIQAALIACGIPCRQIMNRKRGPYLSLGADGGKSGYVTLRNNNVRIESYKGVVWCGTVENGTLITRRNGCVLISGNSGKYMHTAANWDIVAYKYMAMRLEDKGIPVRRTVNGDPFLRKINIRGHRYLLYHGHDIRTFSSIPWYGMLLRVSRWMSTSRLAPFDAVLMGHYHTLGYWKINKIHLLSSGTMVTDDEWALRVLGWESEPRWWFFGVSDKYPLTWRYTIDLA